MNGSDLHDGRLRMRLGERLRYAVSDLRFRKATTLLNVAAMTLSVAYIVILGFYGMSFHGYQRSVLEDSLPTKVVASCPEVTDRGLRFTTEKVRELSRMDGVGMAFPRIELGVRLSLDGRATINVPVEGTVPADPAMAAARMACGHGVTADDGREIVLGEPLFRKLGGVWTAGGPHPAKAQVEVHRTVNGKDQVVRVELDIVGLLRHQTAEKAHVPLRLAEQLNQWCSGKVAGLPGVDGTPRRPDLTYTSCTAFVPVEHKDRVQTEANHLGVTADLQGEVTVIENNGDIWARIEDAQGRPLNPAGVLAVIGTPEDVALHTERVLDVGHAGGSVRVAALRADDPRWTLAPGASMPSFGQVLAARSEGALNAAVRHVRVVAAGTGRQLPVAADLVCSRETLQWLDFDLVSSPRVERCTRVQTESFDVAQRLDARHPGSVIAAQPTAWALFGIEKPPQTRSDTPDLGLAPHPGPDWRATPDRLMDPDRPDYAPPRAGADDVVNRLLEAIRRNVANVRCGAVYETTVRPHAAYRDAYGAGAAYDRAIEARFIPDDLFRLICGAAETTRAVPGVLPCVLATPHAGRPDVDGHFVGMYRIRVVNTLNADRPEIWFRESDRQRADSTAKRTGIACWGSWRAVRGIQSNAGRDAEALKIGHRGMPSDYSILFSAPLAASRSALGGDADRCRFTEYAAVRASVLDGGHTVARICADGGPICRKGEVLVAELANGPAKAVLSLGGAYEERVTLVASRSVHPGMAFVDSEAFRRLAFEAARAVHGLSTPGAETASLRFADVHAYDRERRRLAARKVALRPLAPLRERPLLKYRVRDAKDTGAGITSDLVTILNMTKPTFAYAAPDLGVSAVVGDQTVQLEGASHADPQAFECGIAAGRWLSATADANEAVIPASMLKRILPRRAPAECVGQIITAQFTRDRRVSASEPGLTIPLRVVGVSGGDRAFAPMDLVRNVSLWSDGKIVFNETRMAFETPLEIYERSGYVRCNLYAADAASVAGVVRRLEAMGYRTEHSLAEQEGLRKLGRVLAFMVVFFCLGCALNAAITVVSTTMMNIRGKTWEIGILRAHGMGSGEVVSIFGMQGAILGCTAFALGVGFVTLVEPWLRSLMADTFGLPMDAVVSSPLWSASALPLFLLVFAVGVAFSLFGVTVPAIGACRLSPVEALRRRE